MSWMKLPLSRVFNKFKELADKKKISALWI